MSKTIEVTIQGVIALVAYLALSFFTSTHDLVGKFTGKLVARKLYMYLQIYPPRDR